MKYIPTIGLEIHAELKTNTKMFCSSKNDPNESKPNVNICPVCMGHPGTLPVINKAAVRHVLRVGLALGSEIADFTEFDRKNYFYPDIPKGYQISQYKYPLVKGGSLSDVDITRVHLEEDTARSLHNEGDYSLVDFNRAGVPLMELVTEPRVESAEQAMAFARELQLLLRCLGASDANMEKGEMRVEANISVAPKGDKLGTKVEVKNLNSFKVVGKAIEFEIERQSAVLENGERVVQETRGWDEEGEKTFSQRMKEESHDYRYFPDPDLPKLKISEIQEFASDTLKASLPELPKDKRERYKIEFNIKEADIESFVVDPKLGIFFESAIKEKEKDEKFVQLSANYIHSDLVGLSQEIEGDIFEKLTPDGFADLITMITENKVSSRGAKDILKVMAIEGGEPNDIAVTKGLFQKSDKGELKAIAEEIIKENEQVVAEYKGGKEASLQFLIGQGMKKTQGSANPGVLKEIFIELLKT